MPSEAQNPSKQLPDWLPDFLTDWVSEWMTDRRSANDNWNCLWLPTWFQFRFRLQPERKQNNKKKGSHNFLRYWCAFHGPKANQKTQQFPPCLPSIWVQLLLLMGLRAAGRWWGKGGEDGGVWRQSRWQQAEATLNRFRVAVWHLTDNLPQLLCRWRCRKDRWKRSTSCVHVAALSPLPGSPLNPRLVPTPFALTNVCRLLIEAAKLANSRKAAAQKKNGRGSWATAEKIETNIVGSGGVWGAL